MTLLSLENYSLTYHPQDTINGSTVYLLPRALDQEGSGDCNLAYNLLAGHVLWQRTASAQRGGDLLF